MTAQPSHLDLSDLDWTFGDRLRMIRRAVAVNQDEFAVMLDCGKKSLAAWELGVNTPRNVVSIAKRIELAYGVPAAWTLGIQDSPYPNGKGPDGGLPGLDSNQEPSEALLEQTAPVIPLRPRETLERAA